MKKLISFGLMLVGLVSAQAANYSYQNFLNGWNLCVSNNTTVTAGYTNNLFTYYHGEVYNSFTTNGVGNTNNLAPDAFVSSGVDLFADANGDVVSNAVIVAYIGNTNWIPVVTTNTAGQYFIPPAGFTNLAITTAYAGWPLASGMLSTYMYPATTVAYPAFTTAVSTNTLTFNFVRSTGPVVMGVASVWETTASFTFTATQTGIAPLVVMTNPPVSWLSGGRIAKLASVVSANDSVNAISLVNYVGIGQWKP